MAGEALSGGGGGGGRCGRRRNKAGYTAIEVACGWAGAILEVTRLFRQEQ